MKTLKKLCASGKTNAKSAKPGVDKMGAFFYDGEYYWRSPQAALNFELQMNEPVQGAKKGCKFEDSELMIWQIPA